MATTRRPRYPAEYESDVLLKDGSTVHLRPVRPQDEAAMRSLFARLSPRSLYLRSHHQARRVSPEEVRRFTHVDYEDAFGLVATLGEPPRERIVACGMYNRLDGRSDRAEIAFTVEDSHQGRGIASQLLDQLAITARDHGVAVFEADVLGENESMMEVFKESGFPLQSRLTYGTFHVAFPISETAEAERKAAEREVVAEANSLRVFFQPRSVAVIGASRQRGTIGAEIFHNILGDGFTGVVYPINPRADAVAAVKAYASVLDVPDEIDLAIVAVPAESVLDVAGECARKGVRGLVVISAGFRETGPQGAEREAALLARARQYGMRIIGPNCMGVLNAAPSVSLNATFSPVFPPFGNVGLLSQSGALGLALLDYARRLNIGLSTFVSVGNKADVSGNDLIQYWEQDPATGVILLYLESFGNPRKFARLARRISGRKPIVAVKSGRTAAGSRAAASHTGALATADVASEALFRQAGVIRVDTLEQLFDVASLLAHQPIPRGRRVAILTNAGGPGIMAADACEAYGLEVIPLPDATVAALREFLPPEAGLSNPTDMIASASAGDYGRALRILLQDEGIDSVIIIFIPPLVTGAEAVAAAIRDAATEMGREKTLLTCFMSARGAPPELSAGDGCTLPSYAFPESAALALAKVCEHGEWRKRPQGSIPLLAVDAETGRGLVDTALAGARGGIWLDPQRAADLLRAYGIRSARITAARTPAEAVAVAEAIGYPVAVKLASSTITHKSDIGGVVLGVHNKRGVRDACRRIRERVQAAGRLDEMEGVVVQEMVPEGIEAIVGVTQDPLFGPLMMFGLGGTFVELLKDVAFRIHSLTDVDAREMVRAIKSYPLLEGWRGADPGDIAALEEILLRVSRLVEDIPEIAEMDLNPVKVLRPGEGCAVVDVRVLLRSVLRSPPPVDGS
ncbi:MAG: GNAT family N-acetyltransferase [Dehalococcoidia bacterium]|nr:GNAT family N-acetyltransferase [Dehalococcoidia bacterium]